MKRREEALEQLMSELRRVFRDWAAAADSGLRTLGIRAADRAILEFLAREEEPVSISQLARRNSVSRQHIQQTLRRLSHPEWIDEIADPADRRTSMLQLSRKGWVAWKQIRRTDRILLKRMARRLPKERIPAVTDLLRDLRRELNRGKEDERG